MPLDHHSPCVLARRGQKKIRLHSELEITVDHTTLNFLIISRIWPNKSNLLGQIYYTFSLGKQIIVHKMFLRTLINGQPNSNPYSSFGYFSLVTNVRLMFLDAQMLLDKHFSCLMYLKQKIITYSGMKVRFQAIGLCQFIMSL